MDTLQFPVMTRKLGERLRRVLATETIAGLTSAAQQAGNPYALDRRQFGGAVAVMARAAPPHGWWNRVIGFTPDDIDQIDRILAFYREARRRCHVDLDPLALTPELGNAMGARGLAPAPSGTVLYGIPRTDVPEAPAGVVIREIGRNEADSFAELWADGFEVAGDDRAAALNIRKGWFTLPENRLYVASADGAPAGMAAVYIQDGVGHLNVGATLPAFRERGIHLALVYRRIADAARAGCDLVMGDTGGFASTSQNNMERAGMRIAFTRLTMIDRAS
jgi:hypothetical protein